MEQWEVVAEDFSETCDNLKYAKRLYGEIKNDLSEGWVLLLYRSSQDSDWLMLQKFMQGSNVEIPSSVKQYFEHKTKKVK